GKARRLHRLGGRRVAIAEEDVGGPGAVLPAADKEGGRVRPGVREDGEARRRLPAVLDEMDAGLFPLLPEPPQPMDPALAAQRPHVDVLATDPGVRRLD